MRRFFQSSLRELEDQKFIETIQIQGRSGKYVKCVRLVDAEASGNAGVDEDDVEKHETG